MLAKHLLYPLLARMKSFMIFGSLVGFVIGAGFSYAEGCPWTTTLWRAPVAALLAALLARWWCGVWIDGLREAAEQRRQAPATPAATTKPPAKL